MKDYDEKPNETGENGSSAESQQSSQNSVPQGTPNTPNMQNGAQQQGYIPPAGRPNVNPYSQQQGGYYGHQGYYGQNGGYTPNGAFNPNAYNRPGQNYVYNGAPAQNYPQYAPGQVSTKGTKKGRKVFAVIIAAIAVFAIIMTVLTFNGKTAQKNKGEKIDAPSITENETPGGASEEESGAKSGALSAEAIYQKIKDASVGILVYNGNTNTQAGQGSGVIIGEKDKYTYIITCAHIVNGAGKVRVQLSDESQYDAQIIGYDSRTDIGVVRISETGLTAIEIGKSDDLSVGSPVYAIGNPGGTVFAGSFTDGMVSAISRPVNSQIGYEMKCIQHTAAINPGNSGGALVNEYGQLVGINSSKIVSTEYEGMSFAVPSSTFVDVYNDIVAHGYVTNRAKIGIYYFPASSNSTYSMLAGASGLPDGSLVISSISADSSLAGQDVRQGDVIIKVNGEELESANTLPEIIEKSSVGDKLVLTLCRFDSNYRSTQFDVTVTLVEDKGDTEVEQTTQPQYYYNPFGGFFDQ
ncbi:MAG: trypsin-like serine protease [Ruminococcaceae bacterium]|nr:trypsin-like serine protease [Oscillospiraceae bacterium]